MRQGGQLPPAALIEPNASSGGEKNPAFALSVPVYFAYVVDIHDCRPVQPDELGGVQFRFKGSNALAQQVLLPSDMEANVVVSCFNPLDFIHRNDRTRIAIFGEETLRIRTLACDRA